MVGGGFLGAGSHMIFRVPEPLPVIPPCPTCETCPEIAEVAECPEQVICPEIKPAWYSQVWDAVTPGTATAEIPPVVVVAKYQKLTPTPAPTTKITIVPEPVAPPPEPRSIFQIWWQDDVQTWLRKTFGWKEKVITKLTEKTVVVETQLSNDAKILFDKNMARIVELTSEMVNKKWSTKQKKGIEKKIHLHVETIAALLEKDDGRIPPLLNLNPEKSAAPTG